MSQTSANLLTAGLLVVSDTAHKDPSTDKSTKMLKDFFAEQGSGKWDNKALRSNIVPDDIELIRKALKEWTDVPDYINLVVVTGGTGFAARDWTPEAITPLLHRQAPGLVHAMLAASFVITPFAMMSRPAAGVRNKTIIVTVPGSPKGAKENLEAIFRLLPHACMQAAGEDSRSAHIGGVKQLEANAGLSSTSNTAATTGSNHRHSHSHHHDHDHNHSHGHGGHKVPKAHTSPSERPQQSNDPRLGATHRARSSPYTMLSVDDAVKLILDVSPSPTPITKPLTPDLVGYTVSQDIKALEAVPAYRASIVDGYAVIVPSPSTTTTTTSTPSSIKGTFPVASVSHAQAASIPPPLEPNTIARITTGAPLPANANAVVMVEDTTIATTTADATEEATVTILTADLTPGENIREPGSDIALNTTILQSGTLITSVGGEIGLLAASGTSLVPVFRLPRVGVLSTGDEVTDISHPGPLSGGMIRDSNRPSLLSLIRGWGVASEVVDLGVARDTPHAQLEEKMRGAFRAEGVDVLVTTGGVSMGELDLLKPTVERAMGGMIHFGRVNMKPGKPTTFASVPFKESEGGVRGEKLVFGLPGNPASAIVTANLFLLPCLQKMSGREGKGLERVVVKVVGRVRCDKGRPEYHRVVVCVERRKGGDGGSELVARSTGMQRSSRVGSLASANALLCLPQKEGFVEDGETCEALMLGPLVGL